MRVIAGRFKGRRLTPPGWAGLRPTSDKLRETLFNILSPCIEGARVLDGFAGTGAVGIEALSRGAAHVTFVEKDRRAVALIEANLAACGVDRAAVVTSAPAFATELMVAYAYDTIARRHPLGFFGMVHVLEGTSVALALAAARQIQQALDLPPAAFRYLRSHGTLDQMHTAHFATLMNRLDDVVVFHALSTEELGKIVDIQLDALGRRLAKRRLTLDVTEAAREWLAMNGFDPVFGARPLRRLVQSSIGDQLAKELLAGEVREGDTVRVDLDPTAEGGTGALLVGRALPVAAR